MFLSGSHDRPNTLLQGMQDCRCAWSVDEYDTLWSTFEGVALWMKAGSQAADTAFQRAINLCDKREERIFMPLCYLWWGRVAAAENRFAAANDRWAKGEQIATDMGATLFVTQIREARQSVTPDQVSNSFRKR